MWWRKLRRGRRKAPVSGELREPNGTVVSRRAVRKECRVLLAQMPVPRPFSLDRLISNIETARGRRIKLVAIPDRLLDNTDVCGLWLRLDGAPVDLILYVQGTTAFHRLRIILHELAHLWCDDVTDASLDQLARLLPDFPPAMLQRLTSKGRVMARHRYDTHAEVRAETLADLLHHEAYATDYIEDSTLRHLDEDLSHLHYLPRPRPPRKSRVRL